MMIAEGLTALEALGLAVRCEIDAQELYQNLVSLTDNDLLKERFLNLSQEEKRHQLLLEKKYKEMFPNVELKIPPCQLPGEMMDKSVGKGMGIKGVLKLAIDESKRVKEFYLDCTETTTDLSGKRMFRFLADMKFSHQMMLNAELEMIEKYPSYYEGPSSWEAETRLKAPKIKR
jgi:rubrerythrin